MVDIEAWLKQLALPEYTASFADNGVDSDLLLELTNEDLKDLGVSRLRDRKLLLKAIAELASDEGGKLASEADAERRQLTVMFCDLVGSTALSTQYDPEDLRQLITGFQNKCREAIRRYDGFIARYMGDGILVYFGYPQAYEDSPERAVRASLAITESMTPLNAEFANRFDAKLAVRVGVATGPVVVGDIVGDGAAEEAAVVGEAPNLAARLQSIAQPDEVVIAASTQRLLGALFDYGDLGEHELKGFSMPVRAWRVLGERDVGSRFDAKGGGSKIPLVGREDELGVLLRAWELSKGGSGRAVVIGGEAGMGKSRLCEALEEHIRLEAHLLIRVQCSPFHSNSTLYPIVEQMRAGAGIRRDDSIPVKLDKLERLLEGASIAGVSTTELLAPLLSIPTDTRFPALDLSPARRKILTLDALLQRLAKLDADNQLALILEDAHWVDPTTMEFLELLIARLTDAKLLLVITHRPEFDAPWGRDPNVDTISLHRLGTEHVVDLVRGVAKNLTLPTGAIDEILVKTDGIPLFVEELTKMLLERTRQLETADGDVESDSLAGIPTTIQDLLLARLDQLGASKKLAQQAACFGRTFSLEQLATAIETPAEKLSPMLKYLTDAGLIIDADGVGVEYSFKHALIQETAYDSLLLSSRGAIHRRIAESLEAELAEQEPEILAHHFGRAQMFDKEIDYWQMAGLKAMGASAFLEASSHLRNAIARLDKLPDADRGARDLELHVQIAVPLTLTLGWAAPEVRDVYERAYELCQQMTDSPLVYPVLHGMFRYYFVNGNHRAAEEIAMRDLERADQTGDDGIILEFALHPGVVRFYTGRPAEALPYFERCISLYDDERHRDHTEVYSACPATIATAHMANALAILGRPEEAFACNQRCVDYAERSDHIFSRIWAMSNHAMNHILYEDFSKSAALAEKMITAAEEQGFINWLSQGRVWLGWSAACAGDTDTGLAQVLGGIELWEMTGARLMQPFYFALLADTYRRAGHLYDARVAIDKSLAVMADTGEYWTKPLNDILFVSIARALDSMPPDDADARLRKLATSAAARGEWIWAVRAERERVLFASAVGLTVDGGGLRDVLCEFHDVAAYPLLRDAAKLTQQ